MKRMPLRWPAIEPPADDASEPTLARRLLWMACIWVASVVALLAVAGVLKLVLRT